MARRRRCGNRLTYETQLWLPYGGVPEWSKGADCKSVASASMVRIHPPPPKEFVIMRRGSFLSRLIVVNGNHPIAYDDPLGNARAYQLGDRIITNAVAPFKNHRTTHKTSHKSTMTSSLSGVGSQIATSAAQNAITILGDEGASDAVDFVSSKAKVDISPPMTVLKKAGIVSVGFAVVGAIQDIVTYHDDPTAVACALFIDAESYVAGIAMGALISGIVAATLLNPFTALVATIGFGIDAGVALDGIANYEKKQVIGY